MAFKEQLLAEGDSRQLIQFNKAASLQGLILADGLVPNSSEFTVRLEGKSYVAQRAEHLLTGEVRVCFADEADVNVIRQVVRGGASGATVPFRRGNRITQVFSASPEIYGKYGLKGHEGLDLVPKAGDRDIYCIEDGRIIEDCDFPHAAKIKEYGNYVVVYNRATSRLWYYCHMIENFVQLGQRVRRGDKLGRMGETGNTDGAHLHLGLKPVNALGLPTMAGNGFSGFVDPQPEMSELDRADTHLDLRDKLLDRAEKSQVIAFNTQAALQRQMFSDGYCPNSTEFDLEIDGLPHVVQRAETLATGAVRVYYAPLVDFGNVQFVER